MEGGCWGLITILAAFMIQVFAFGTSSAIGVYNIEFLQYFDNDTIGVSLIAAINWAVFLGSGPVASFLMRRFSYRKIALVGSFLIFVGILLMTIFPYIPVYCVAFGLLAGFGSCLVYIPSHVLSGMYYDRHRSLATGIATSGSGFGSAVMPITIGFLIDHYGWRQSLLVVAGINLHLFVCAALLKLPPAYLYSSEEYEKKEVEELLTENGQAEIKDDAMHGDCNICENMLVEKITEKLTVGKTCARNELCEIRGRDGKEEDNVTVAYTTTALKMQDKEMKATEKVLNHIYVFTSLGFDIYFISNIMWNVTGSILLSFAPDFITERGFEALDAAWLVTLHGCGDFVGAIIGGGVGNLWQTHRQAQYVFANIALGISTALLPFAFTYAHFACILVFCGLCFGAVLGLLVVVMTDLIGPANLGDGLGYLMIANGIGSFIGPAASGYIRKATGSYENAFYTGGACGVVGGMIMWFIPLLKSCCRKKKLPDCTEMVMQH